MKLREIFEDLKLSYFPATKENIADYKASIDALGEAIYQVMDDAGYGIDSDPPYIKGISHFNAECDAWATAREKRGDEFLSRKRISELTLELHTMASILLDKNHPHNAALADKFIAIYRAEEAASPFFATPAPL